MRNLKKLLAVVVAICVLATMTIPAFAAETKTDAQIVEALGVLKGDGAGVTDTYLAKGTNRMQAAQLYLRLIGLEDEALAELSTDNFDDADLVYAGGQRILAYLKANPDLGWNGVGGNKFEPTGAASAQMIYKVMLEAMGYKQGVDFEWADVLTFAADKGLSKIADVTNLTNNDMATALVEALNAKVKDSDTTLAAKLVADGVIDEAAAAEAGLVAGYVALDVDTVAAVASTKVDVTLKTAATKVDGAVITIKDAEGAALEVKGITLAGEKSVRVVTAAQVANTVYTMTIDGKDYKFVGLAADTDKPELSSAVAVDNTTVRLTFNETVENIANIANYTIEGLTVLKAEYDTDADGNLVKTQVVLTTSSQTNGTIYKVVVTGVTDVEGNVINADKDEFQFGGLAPDTSKPELVSAVALTNTKVEVDFNEDMDKATLENIANYTIEGLTVVKAEQQKDKSKVKLTTSAQTNGTIYKLVVAGVTDKAGNPINSDKDEFQFGGLAPDTDKPELVSAVATSNTAVTATFNEDMDKASVENIANYAIEGLTIVKAEQDKDDAKIVKLTTSAQTNGNIYKLVVSNVTDESGNPINTDKDEFQFGGLAADTGAPELVTVTSTGNKEVTVVFNEVMDETTAKQPYNYYFGTELGYPTKVEKAPAPNNDGKTWILTTKAQEQKVYKLVVSGVKDTSGNLINSDKDEKSFSGNASADTGAPKVTAAVALDNQTVNVTFNEKVTGVDATDFVFSVDTGTETQTTVIAGAVPTGIKVSDDKKVVTLQFATAKMTPGVVYKVTVTAGSLSDEAGNAIAATDNSKPFAGSSISNDPPKVAAAGLINNQTLKITFSEAITVTGTLAASDFTITPASGSPAFDGTFVKAVLSSDKKSITVYYSGSADTNKFATGKVYEVAVANTNITDELDVASLATGNDAKKSFAGIATSAGSPKISSVIAVDKNTLDVTFDQAVNYTTTAAIAVTLDGVAVASDDVALVRTEGKDGNKIRIFFSEAEPFIAGKVYKLELTESAVVSENGTAMAAADNNKTFAAISTNNPGPKVTVVTKINATTIEVKFSEKITGLKDDGSDFAITGATINGASMFGTDGDTVRINLSGALTAGVKELTFQAGTTIKDEAGVGAVDTAKAEFAY